jgi:hypothetical protein
MLLKSYLPRRVTCQRKTTVAKCSSDFTTTGKNVQAKFASFIEKKKELDRTRWEKIKEASRTIDHIAKNDVKQTFDLLKELNLVHPTNGQSEDKADTELKSVDLADEESS